MRDFAKRSAVGAIYTLVFIIATLVSWYTTLIVITITAALCCYEFLRMAQADGHRPYVIIGTVAAGAIPLICGFIIQQTHILAVAMFVAFIVGCIMLIRFFIDDNDTIVDVALSIFGYLYCGLTLVGFLMIRSELPGFQGGLLALMVLISIWLNDAAAYVGGSLYGRHLFSPKISPKKTWEGVITGVVCCTIIWALIPLVVPDCGFGYVYAIICGVICGIVGIMGDLTESHIKRSFHTKDSGNLMPGHGGLLDRSDSLIFVSVVGYVLLSLPFILQELFGVVL
ncbi:MAG: phosphatidate cytidylyltransferase [Coriobacteriaceae bacterium]|nr:phosphatidate cytidylyltransferase [Coriobacteriaceae bacterium]